MQQFLYEYETITLFVYIWPYFLHHFSKLYCSLSLHTLCVPTILLKHNISTYGLTIQKQEEKELYTRITAGGSRVPHPLTTKIYTSCRKTPWPNFLEWGGGGPKQRFILEELLSEMRPCRARGRQIGSKVGNQVKPLKYS